MFNFTCSISRDIFYKTISHTRRNVRSSKYLLINAYVLIHYAIWFKIYKICCLCYTTTGDCFVEMCIYSFITFEFTLNFVYANLLVWGCHQACIIYATAFGGDKARDIFYHSQLYVIRSFREDILIKNYDR